MTRAICLAIMLAFCPYAHGEKGAASASLVGTAEQVIDFCMSEYSRLSGKAFFSEVDRAYVHTSADRFFVLFAHGEFGTFGAPSRHGDYRRYLNCSVLVSGDMVLYGMALSLFDRLFEYPDDESYKDFFRALNKSSDEGFVRELLFKRQDNQFVFVASQYFSPDRASKIERPYQLRDGCHDDTLEAYPPEWRGFAALVEQAIKKEIAGKKPDGCLQSWNDYWLTRIGSLRKLSESDEVADKRVDYIYARREEVGLPAIYMMVH